MDKEINRMVAEKVMGWGISSIREDGSILTIESGLFNPSENISDAWTVMNKLLEDDYTVTMTMYKKCENPCVVIMGNIIIEAESAPMAICLAALEAVK